MKRFDTILKMSACSMLSMAAITIAPTLAADTFAEKRCPAFLDHEFRRLHSAETVNLCSLYTGKPMVIVNTASHCGFTKQFEGLEALYQAYKDQGVEVVGFASDDFKQEAKDEAEAASVCYENYGVSFTMIAPTAVTDEAANPIFQYLNSASEQPGWNFNKYLISTRAGGKASGQNLDVQHFGSRVKPRNSALEKTLQDAL